MLGLQAQGLEFVFQSPGRQCQLGGVLAVIPVLWDRGRQSSEVIGKLVYLTWLVQEYESTYLQNTKNKVDDTQGTPKADLWLPHPYPSRCKCTPARNASSHREGGHCTLETRVIWLTVQLKNMQKLRDPCCCWASPAEELVLPQMCAQEDASAELLSSFYVLRK